MMDEKKIAQSVQDMDENIEIAQELEDAHERIRIKNNSSNNNNQDYSL